MSESDKELFLSQFRDAKDHVNSWPAWMKSNARVATATLSTARVGPKESPLTDPAKQHKK